VQLDGRVYYLGEYDSEESHRDYERIVAEWLVNGWRRRTLGKGRAGAQSINELLVDYLRHAESHYVKDGKVTHEVANIKLAMKPLKRLYGDMPVEEFGPLALKAVRQAMIEKGLCRRSINIHVGRLRRVFKWGVENELVPPSVFHGLQAVPGLRRGRGGAKESEPVKPVPEAAVKAVLKVVSRPIAAMIRVQYLTGMRPGEVCSMRMRNLDCLGRIWIYKPESHKTEHFGHKRVINLGPEAQKVLRPFLRLDPEAHLFNPREAVKERYEKAAAARKTPRWPSHMRRNKAKRKRRPGRKPKDHYTRMSYYRAVVRGCKRAKIDSWHPHQLRHNAATRIRKEFGPEHARAVLGHQSLVATEIYAERDAGMASEVMAKIG